MIEATKCVRDTSAFQCPVCGVDLVRADTYWVCPKAFHSKAIPDTELPNGVEFQMAVHRSYVAMPFVDSLKRLLRKISR